MPNPRLKRLLFLALPALILGGLSLLNIVPLAALASRFSPRGQISASFHASLAHAQTTLAIALLIAAAVSPFLVRITNALCAKLERTKLRTLLTILALAAFTLGLASQELIFAGIPHVTDATSHLFQAKIFALGKLHAPLPPVHEAFFQFQVFMTRDNHWFTAYPPGTALYYTPFTALGLTRIAIPLAFAAFTAAATWLVARFFSQLRAACFGALLVTSPLALLLAGSYMSHIPLLAAATLGLGLAVASIDRNPNGWLPKPSDIAAGLFLGWAAIIRPQDLFLVGIFVLTALTLWPRQWLPAIRLGIRILPGLAIPALVQLAWNWHVFGTPLALGYGRTNVGSLTPLLVPHWGITDTFTLPDALQQTFHTLLRFDPVIAGWPTALLLLPLVLFRRPDRRDLLCAAALTTVILFHLPYDYYGNEYEARFYSTALPFALLLLTRAVEFRMPNPECRNQQFGVRNSEFGVRSSAFGILPPLIVAFTLYAALHTWPKGLLPTYAHDYEQATPALHAQAIRTGHTNALILIDTAPPNDFRYTSAFPHNDPLLKNPILYARHLPDKLPQLTAAFPTRKLYLYVPTTNNWNTGTFQPLETPTP